MNTLNVCVGHLPFPSECADYVDLLISPNIVSSNIKRKVIVPDDIFGENGHSLSEYAQLFWLLDNIDAVAKGYEYLNIFQYRRFISQKPVDVEKSLSIPWANVVEEEDVAKYSYCFERINAVTSFNTLLDLGEAGVMLQYKDVHCLEDYLAFVQYLMEVEFWDKEVAANFIKQRYFVPSCSIGIYSVEVFKSIFSLLRDASGFLTSSKFKIREGYQRRSMGYLLERLHSFIIVEYFSKQGIFCSNMLIQSESTKNLNKDRIQ